MSFSFSSLNLSGVKAATGGSVLPPGEYVVKVKKAEITDIKDGGKALKVVMVETNDKGVITDQINVHLPGRSEEAVRIGMETLRALCEFGGHPDPDNIGAHGVQSLVGLTVGIRVGSEKYEGKDRSRVTGYKLPSEVSATAVASNGAASTAPAKLGPKNPF